MATNALKTLFFFSLIHLLSTITFSPLMSQEKELSFLGKTDRFPLLAPEEPSLLKKFQQHGIQPTETLDPIWKKAFSFVSAPFLKIKSTLAHTSYQHIACLSLLFFNPHTASADNTVLCPGRIVLKDNLPALDSAFYGCTENQYNQITALYRFNQLINHNDGSGYHPFFIKKIKYNGRYKIYSPDFPSFNFNKKRLGMPKYFEHSTNQVKECEQKSCQELSFWDGGLRCAYEKKDPEKMTETINFCFKKQCQENHIQQCPEDTRWFFQRWFWPSLCDESICPGYKVDAKNTTNIENSKKICLKCCPEMPAIYNHKLLNFPG